MKRREKRDKRKRDICIAEKLVDNEKEANKGAWGMPRLSEKTKDVISCEKLRGVANEQRSVDVRMGQPPGLKNQESKDVKRGELKHLSTCRRRK